LSTLRGDIESHPNKRLYIKLAGQVASKKPIQAKSDSGHELSAVLTLNEIVHLSGISTSSPRPTVSDVSTADEVTVELGEGKIGFVPKLIVDPKCLELIERDLIHTKEEEIGTRMVSLVLAVLGVSWPYRSITKTKIVRQDCHVFAALDATVDFNGNISLIKPNAFTRRAIMTTEQFTTVQDDLQFSKQVWNSLSMASGLASLALAAYGFKKSK
jgi:hypothetical protein